MWTPASDTRALVSVGSLSSDSRYRAISEERDELRERVRQLEELLFDDSWVPSDWALTGSEITVLNVLVLRGFATKQAIHTALYGEDPEGGAELHIVDVFICKLRKKADRLGISIETQWGAGYRLEASSRLFLAELRKAAA